MRTCSASHGTFGSLHKGTIAKIYHQYGSKCIPLSLKLAPRLDTSLGWSRGHPTCSSFWLVLIWSEKKTRFLPGPSRNKWSYKAPVLIGSWVSPRRLNPCFVTNINPLFRNNMPCILKSDEQRLARAAVVQDYREVAGFMLCTAYPKNLRPIAPQHLNLASCLQFRTMQQHLRLLLPFLLCPLRP